MRKLLALLALAALSISAPVSVTVSSDEVTSFLSQLVTSDSNRPQPGQIVVAYQDQASSKNFDHDNAAKPFFTTVDTSLFALPTYKTLIDLISLYPDLNGNEEDPNTPERIAAARAFIDEVSKTTVFTEAWTFLSAGGLASDDFDEFTNELFDLWFTVFARNQKAGSSGFKSNFVGEYLKKEVVGLTNWIRFYLLELKNTVNYHGWFQRQIDVQVSLQFGLELPEGEKQAMKSNLLISTSPEFEFMAYSVCILSGNSACHLMISGNEVVLNIDATTVGGKPVIQTAYPTIGATSAATTKKPATTKAPPKVDTELQTLVDQMRDQDADKVTTKQYKLTWGVKLGNNPKPTKDNLMSNVDESVFTHPVYANLKKVYDNNLLNPDVCVAESDYNAGFKKSIFQGLLDNWATTKPFTLMHNYLVKKGKANSDLTAFKQYLTMFWFGTYSRCQNNKKIMGSSGFEHVFSGEFKGNTIDGHHNWMKYYLDQKAGKIKYYGYYSEDAQLTGTFEYDWSDRNKKTGGMLFSTSPAFDFSLYTACALSHSGATACRFTIDGYQLAVTSYTQDCDAGTCLSTAYPVDEL